MEENNHRPDESTPALSEHDRPVEGKAVRIAYLAATGFAYITPLSFELDQEVWGSFKASTLMVVPWPASPIASLSMGVSLAAFLVSLGFLGWYAATRRALWLVFPAAPGWCLSTSVAARVLGFN